MHKSEKRWSKPLWAAAFNIGFQKPSFVFRKIKCEQYISNVTRSAKNNRKHSFIFSCSSEMFANATNAFDKAVQYLCIMQPLIQKKVSMQYAGSHTRHVSSWCLKDILELCTNLRKINIERVTIDWKILNDCGWQLLIIQIHMFWRKQIAYGVNPKYSYIQVVEAVASFRGLPPS